MSPSKDAMRILIQCTCGKKMTAPLTPSAVSVQCRACGKTITVPSVFSVSQTATTPQPLRSIPHVTGENIFSQIADPQSGTSALHTPSHPFLSSFGALWLFVVIFAIACVVFVIEYDRQSRIVAANERVTDAIKAAKDWMAKGNLKDGIDLEKTLAEAVSDQSLTDPEESSRILQEVRDRLKTLEEQAARERGRARAANLLTTSHLAISKRDFPEAIRLLNLYVDDPDSDHAPTGQKLLAACEMATSDSAAQDALLRLNDSEFAAVENGGSVRYDAMNHPELTDAWNQNIKRNLLTTANRRMQRQQEQIARIERERKDAEERDAMVRRQAETAAKAESDRLKQEAAAAKDVEKKALAVKILSLAIPYAKIQLEIDRVKEVTADTLKSMDGAKSSIVVSEIKDLGTALRQEGTAKMRSDLRELSRMNVDPSLKEFHRKFSEYVEATIEQTHTHALAFENLSSPPGIAALRQLPTVNSKARDKYAAWETEWNRVSAGDNRTWNEFVKLVDASEK